MPLIPNVVTDIPDIDGNPLTVKTLLRRQIDVTGPSMLAAVLQGQGMDAREASRRAKQILQESRRRRISSSTKRICFRSSTVDVRRRRLSGRAVKTKRGWLPAPEFNSQS